MPGILKNLIDWTSRFRPQPFDGLARIGLDGVRDRDQTGRLAVNAESNLLGGDTMQWVNRLDAEHGNLLAAIDWSLKSEDPDYAMQIVGALPQWDAWHNREGAELSWRVVQSPLTSRPTSLRAKALHTAGIMQLFQGNLAQARTFFEEAISISKASGAHETYVWALAHLGSVVALEGDYARSRACLEQAIAEAEPSARSTLGWSFAYMADTCMLQDEREQARQLYARSVARLRELRNRNYLAYPLRRLAELALDQRDYRQAFMLCEESLRLNVEGGDQRAIIACLAGFAAIAAECDRAVPAVRLFGAAQSLLHMASASLLTLDRRAYDRSLGMLRPRLDETTFEIAWAEGSELTIEQAIELALMNSIS